MLCCALRPADALEIGLFATTPFTPCPRIPLGRPAVGGNHEAANYLWELYYGGWAAPNIYFLGYAGVVNFGGIRIGGLSGIYKDQHYALVGGWAPCGCKGGWWWAGAGRGSWGQGREAVARTLGGGESAGSGPGTRCAAFWEGQCHLPSTCPCVPPSHLAPSPP